jgi:hypothetical protein
VSIELKLTIDSRVNGISMTSTRTIIIITRLRKTKRRKHKSDK